ncbi:peptide chain release factor PrfB1, chloroplastic [Tanacetum coccineum]
MESVVQMMLVSPIISSSSHNKSSSCHFNNSLSYTNNNSNKSYLFSLSTTPSKVIFATPDAGVSSETGVWAMQDFYSLRKEIEATSQRVKEIRASAGLEQLGEELAKLETATASDSFWDDRTSAQQTLLALTDVKDKLNLLKEFQSQVDDVETIVNLTEEMEATDTALLEEAATIVKELNKALDKFELSQLLSGPYDKEGAVINITAGAGGTDAQDWADMLLRMYVRWGERQRYKTRVVEKSMGEEAGIKSATIELEGRYAFGYLSGEKGTHRIVRQSPFNAKGLRQTSFSGVEVMPLLPEDSLNVEIPEEDLQIGFSRAGGSGGQNVNKVETAVRITHIPTGVTVFLEEVPLPSGRGVGRRVTVHIPHLPYLAPAKLGNVVVRNNLKLKSTVNTYKYYNLAKSSIKERSQLANKIKALSRLKAKLLVIAVEQRASEIKQIRGDTVKADWGQQIRNYVFHPYKLVKDVRTGHETTDIVSVMDGELDPFIKAYLRYRYSESMAN